MLHKIERHFCENQIVLKFYSLHIELFSLECLQWVLLSMMNDRMTPSEKNIQNRIKE